MSMPGKTSWILLRTDQLKTLLFACTMGLCSQWAKQTRLELWLLVARRNQKLPIFHPSASQTSAGTATGHKAQRLWPVKPSQFYLECTSSMIEIGTIYHNCQSARYWQYHIMSRQVPCNQRNQESDHKMHLLWIKNQSIQVQKKTHTYIHICIYIIKYIYI